MLKNFIFTLAALFLWQVSTAQTDSLSVASDSLNGEIVLSNKALVTNVLNDYTLAFGGEKKLKKFNNVTIKESSTVNDVIYNIVKYYEFPNKMTKILSSMGSRIEKVVFDGSKGRSWGVKGYKIYKDQELNELEYEATYFLPLYLEKYKFKVHFDTTEFVEGIESNRLSAVSPNSKLHQFHFSRLTGQLIRWTIYDKDENQDETVLTIDYSDFREVDEFEFPHEIIYTRYDLKVKFKVTLITINDKLDKDIFMLID